jgi:hypothetical protein
MTDRPQSLEFVEGYGLATTYGHQYAFGVQRELVVLDAGGDHTRRLLAESADITLREMPGLTSDLRSLGREWFEQELLDPPKAERTARALEVRFAQLRPKLEALLLRQDEIVAELVRLLNAARRG